MNAASVLLLLMLAGVEQPSPSVAFITYDAGETLALLPVAPLLRDQGMEVRWVPLTPWSADLLATADEPFLPLPDDVGSMAHLRDRDVVGALDHWTAALARAPPDLAVLGMVSGAQGRLAALLRESGVPTRGYHDGFQPPGPAAIQARVAPSFDEIWVPTERVKAGFEALGPSAPDVPVVVTDQPTLEAWRRAAEEVDTGYVRRRLRAELVRSRAGAPAVGQVLTWAGQSIPPPQSSAVLDVETPNSTPLDAGGRWCRFRPTLLAGRPDGPHHHPGHRLTPMPSPIAAAGPRPPPCTASSGSTWGPTSPWPTKPTPWATACQIT